MPKVFALIAVAALPALLTLNALSHAAGAQTAFIPIPAARAAAAPFPTAPAAATTTAPLSDKTAPAAPGRAKAAVPGASKAPVATVASAVPAKKTAAQAPVRLSIPAIGLSERVVPMGVNSKGDLEVPAGSTSDIGWYAKGTVPGDKGSAVMDAHVFAGFSHLDKVAAGDGIDVAMADGTTRRFIVTATKTFALADLTPQELYSQDDGRYLHLITCAGTLTPDHSTYTQRLVVYAALAK